MDANDTTMPAAVWLAGLPGEQAEEAQRRADLHPLASHVEVQCMSEAIRIGFDWSQGGQDYGGIMRWRNRMHAWKEHETNTN